METPLFYGFLAAHIISLIIGMGAVMVIDVFGLMWLFKKAPLPLVVKVGNVTQRLIWLGWGGLVLSGIGLITLKGYVDNLTMIKLFFVVLVGANGLFMHTIKKSMASVKGNKVPAQLMFRITLVSMISQVGWWSAIAIGFLHRHWRHRIDWPQAPEIYMGAIATSIVIIALLGETIFHNPEPEQKRAKE